MHCVAKRGETEKNGQIFKQRSKSLFDRKGPVHRRGQTFPRLQRVSSHILENGGRRHRLQKVKEKKTFVAFLQSVWVCVRLLKGEKECESACVCVFVFSLSAGSAESRLPRADLAEWERSNNNTLLRDSKTVRFWSRKPFSGGGRDPKPNGVPRGYHLMTRNGVILLWNFGRNKGVKMASISLGCRRYGLIVYNWLFVRGWDWNEMILMLHF